MKTEIVRLTEKRTIAVYSHDDVEDILEHNKTLRSMSQKSDWGRHIASIPNIIKNGPRATMYVISARNLMRS